MKLVPAPGQTLHYVVIRNSQVVAEVDIVNSMFPAREAREKLKNFLDSDGELYIKVGVQ